MSRHWRADPDEDYGDIRDRVEKNTMQRPAEMEEAFDRWWASLKRGEIYASEDGALAAFEAGWRAANNG